MNDTPEQLPNASVEVEGLHLDLLERLPDAILELFAQQIITKIIADGRIPERLVVKSHFEGIGTVHLGEGAPARVMELFRVRLSKRICLVRAEDILSFRAVCGLSP